VCSTSKVVRRAWHATRRTDVLPLRAGTFLRGLVALDNHVLDTRRLGQWLGRLIPYERIEEAPVPLAITASDLVTAEPVVLDRGGVVAALLASCAVPGLLPPVRIGGRWLVDGWFMANAPLRWAAAHGADTVYVLRTGGLEPYPTQPGVARRVLNRFRADGGRAAEGVPARRQGLPRRRGAMNQALVSALVAHHIRDEFVAWTPRIDIYLPPAPSVAGLSVYSLSHARGLMDAARDAVSRWLPGSRPLTPCAVSGPFGLVGVND
jgi:NTE family protein